MKQYSPEADIQSKNNENENIFNYPPRVGTEDFPLPQYTPFSPGEHGTKRVSTRHPKCLLGGEQKELLTEVVIGHGNNVAQENSRLMKHMLWLPPQLHWHWQPCEKVYEDHRRVTETGCPLPHCGTTRSLQSRQQGGTPWSFPISVKEAESCSGSTTVERLIFACRTTKTQILIQPL